MKTFERLLKIKRERGAGYLILIDPDKIDHQKLPAFVRESTEAGADGFLVGGSLMSTDGFNDVLHMIKSNTSLPVVIFPGSLFQVSSIADAILFLVLISGRNPEYLIGQHVHASLAIDRSGMEVIPTGYILTGGGGNISSTQYITQTLPIPDDKHELVLATALAGIQLGMELIYLEAGSGTDHPLSSSLVKTVSTKIRKPLLVGGGISEINTVRSFKKSGASILIIGNFLEKNIGFIDDLNKFFK